MNAPCVCLRSKSCLIFVSRRNLAKNSGARPCLLLLRFSRRKRAGILSKGGTDQEVDHTPAHDGAVSTLGLRRVYGQGTDAGRQKKWPAVFVSISMPWPCGWGSSARRPPTPFHAENSVLGWPCRVSWTSSISIPSKPPSLLPVIVPNFFETWCRRPIVGVMKSRPIACTTSLPRLVWL